MSDEQGAGQIVGDTNPKLASLEQLEQAQEGRCGALARLNLTDFKVCYIGMLTGFALQRSGDS